MAGACGACLAEPPIALSSTPPTHRVRPGDTLWDIAGKFLQTPLRWPELQRKNAVAVPELLQPGKVLVLVDGELKEQGSLRRRGTAAVVELAGTAWVQRGEAEPEPLDLMATVHSGDRLLTNRNSFLCLELADGSRVVMPSNSVVRVMTADGNRTQLDLISGRIESQVEKQQGRSFDVRTRTASLGVRGTRFRVRDEAGTVSAEVLDGSVQVTSDAHRQQPVLLRDGEGLLLDTGKALQKQALLPAPEFLQPGGGAGLELEPVPGARRYRAQFAADEASSQLMHEATGPEPRFELPSRLASGFYFVRVTVFDQDDVEGLPGERPIYLRGGSEAVGRATPMSDARIDLRWPAMPGQRFVFELSRSADFAQRLIEIPVAYRSGVSVGPFVVPGTYYWRARPVDTVSAVSASGDAQQAPFTGQIEVPAR